ncbi:TonB-dependent receptor [Terriglobus saanensis]|uniref:TonB-dependent receptor n=1 Tax=Terriglobus saanensis (strain ATCC BAA-1853 / DSM 23119 / SP1PR4) TaxID=401053 RepID=E8V569_TERSS|nr:TonB-dependent receptor [Terriglobus saanensis]ADV83756.1 TonB-dependent receptor [Terriglobus saanensis SP1PR4]
MFTSFVKKIAFLFLFALSCGAHQVVAQEPALTGQIIDPSGAVVVNANVTLSNSQTQGILRTSSGSTGVYSFTTVPPATYTVTITATGFGLRQIPLTVTNQPRTLDIKLQLESASQSVTVQGEGVALQQTAAVGKTNTRLEEMPLSIQIIGRELANAQGDLSLKDTIRNSSGVVQGGSDGFGFGDRFQIRGLEARIYNDGFSDGDERNGIPHSLNGVERIEVLEGPGSSLFGSGPPGGTINMVHFMPSPALHYGGTFQAGSFDLYSGSAFLTGATRIHGLNYRIDGLAQHENGFRALESADYELRPVLSWNVGHHFLTFVGDGRSLQATPDPAGLIYLGATPIASVSRTAKYSTPFSLGDQSLARSTLSDVWPVSSSLTVTNRFSYMYRNLSILRNGDGGTITGTVFSGRQLRKQHDVLNDFDYEAEAVWIFHTGRIRHTLLTGFEAQHQSIDDNRATADLPNITDIFHPVVPETSTAGLVFLQDAKHSGFHDNLSANYFGLYATDQIDVTQRLKVRVGGRQDWWDTTLTPKVFVPGRIFTGTTLIEPPAQFSRDDSPFSWNAGATYRLFGNVSPFFGVARSNLVNFTSEATQNGVQAPENGLQYEAGLKLSAFNNRVVVTGAAFDVKRNNVFTLVGDVPVFNDQKTNGGEANVQLLITRRWKISANGTGQHTWLTDNPSNTAATGKRPVGVPQHIFNLWTTYDVKLPRIHGLNLGGGLTNRDRMFGDILNTKFVPDYTTLDSVLSYTAHRWNASLGFRNLTDTRYFVAANGAGGFVGVPRSFFVTVRKSFGSDR